MIEAVKRSTAGVLCAVLVACGGGGGDGGGAGGGSQQPATPNAATANIGSADYVATSDAASRSALSSFNSLSLLTGNGSVVGASATRAQAFQTTTQRLAVARLLARSTAGDDRAFTLAVRTVTQPCDSGSLLLTIDEASATANTVGDSITVTSQNCVVSGQPVSGSLRLTLTAYAASQTAASGAVTLAFNAFGVPALSLSGSVAGQFAENANGGTVRLSFQGLSASAGGNSTQWFHTVDYAYSVASGAETVAFSGVVGVNGGYVRFDQVTPVVLVGGDPVSGVLQITGANGARVRISAGSTRFDYAYFAPGNTGSTPDATASGLAY